MMRHNAQANIEAKVENIPGKSTDSKNGGLTLMSKRTIRMPKTLITELTQEQEELLPYYREKWRSRSISTDHLDHEKTCQVIANAYDEINYPKPEILFYRNPFISIQNILKIDNYKIVLGKDLHIKLRKRIHEHLNHIVKRQLDETLLICSSLSGIE